MYAIDRAINNAIDRAMNRVYLGDCLIIFMIFQHLEVEFEMTVGTAIGPARVVGLIVGMTFGFP